MARPSKDVSKGRHVVWLSPEFLVRFVAEAEPLNEYDEPNRPLTVADCAALIAVLGRFTNDVVNPLDAGDADLAVEIREKKHPREMPAFHISWQELRDELGLGGRRDVERIFERIRYATVNGKALYEFEGGFTGVAEFKPTFAMRYAHPLNSGVRQAVPVDVQAWARFSCVHSIPIAARLMVWLSTRCRVGQNRTTKYGATYLEHRIDARRVCPDLGLTFKTWNPAHLPIARIMQDLATIGIQTEMHWTHAGRTPDQLCIKAWRSGFVMSAQPAVPNVSRAKEWTAKRNVFNASRSE